MFSSPFFQIQNACIVALMLWGLKERRQRHRHVLIMKSAILWDIILVLQIQFARHAIQKAMEPQTNTLILNTHIILALSTGLLYIPTFFMGTKLNKWPTTLEPEKRARMRFWHKSVGLTTFTMRCFTFITSFFIHLK